MRSFRYLLLPMAVRIKKKENKICKWKLGEHFEKQYRKPILICWIRKCAIIKLYQFENPDAAHSGCSIHGNIWKCKFSLVWFEWFDSTLFRQIAHMNSITVIDIDLNNFFSSFFFSLCFSLSLFFFFLIPILVAFNKT